MDDEQDQALPPAADAGPSSAPSDIPALDATGKDLDASTTSRSAGLASPMAASPAQVEDDEDEDGLESNGLLGFGRQDSNDDEATGARPAPAPKAALSAAAALNGTTRRGDTAAASSTFSSGRMGNIASISGLLPRLDSEVDLPSRPLLPTRHLPSTRATTFSGQPIIIKRKQKSWNGVSSSRVPDAPRTHIGGITLIETPIHRLRTEIEEDAKAAALLASTSASARRAMEARANIKGKGKAIDSSMWVDKYRPQKFADLLGDERVNRETMSWLKEWDRCVFKRRLPKGKKRARHGDDEPTENLDLLGRPRERLLLLSGPPGLGKTTLAAIVAAQAGYAVFEINASDDRSAATVSTRIANVLDAGSSLNTKRPTCIVIDEIDGATGGGDQSFIKSLLKLIQDTPAKKGRNGQKKEAKLLQRPIICICNDLYASALRPLRPFARIVRFNKPPVAVLVKRLKMICQAEGLKADSRSLNKLAEITGCDIRSCLNTLQFVKSKTSELTEATIKSATVGLKDSGTSLQTVWNSLTVPLTAKKSKVGLGVEEGRFINRLMGIVSASGEYDRINQGLFEHYPNLKWQDSNFVRANTIHDWLHFHDTVSNSISSNQHWELYGYLPFTAVPWYTEFASHANAAKPAEFPKQDFECFQRRTLNLEIATALSAAIPPAIRSTFSSHSLLTELAPLLMRILSPDLKPINAQVIKPSEKLTLARLVEIMLLHKLRFYQERDEDGKLFYRLDPPIDVFVTYEGKRAGDIQASRYAVRNLVSQEIEAELLHRHQAAYPEDKDAPLFKKPKRDEDLSEKAAVDFFGRPLASKDLSLIGIDATECDGRPPVVEAPPAKKYKVFYRFHEGSSAAVRKDLRMSALL